MASKTNQIVGQKTNINHVELIDIDDSGLLREVAVVKRDEDGTLHYIDIASLAEIDKGRLKKILMSPHADKYPLWELLSQSRLSNGLNALDFFHYNFIKVKRPAGARASLSSIKDSKVVDDTIVGSEFTNPAEATLDKATKEFKI
jgi:hypothetical protein